RAFLRPAARCRPWEARSAGLRHLQFPLRWLERRRANGPRPARRDRRLAMRARSFAMSDARSLRGRPLHAKPEEASRPSSRWREALRRRGPADWPRRANTGGDSRVPWREGRRRKAARSARLTRAADRGRVVVARGTTGSRRLLAGGWPAR